MGNRFPKPLDEQQIRRLAGSTYFSRGLEYFRLGMVRSIRHIPDGIAAEVAGSELYEVEIVAPPGKRVEFSCSCPIGSDFEFCKHCVAAALQWLKQPSKSTPKPSEKAVATTASAASVAKLAFDNAVHKLGRYGYVEQYDAWVWVQGVERAIGQFERLMHTADAGNIPELCEWALIELDGVSDQIDTEGDELAGFNDRLQDLHCRACQQIQPDALDLAARLFRLQTKGMCDLFDHIFPDYAGILGERGMAEYRRLLENERNKRRPRNGENFLFHLRLDDLMVALERHCGDLDAVARLLSVELPNPAAYVPLVELYRNAGRIDEAIAWAEKGLQDFPDPADHRLVEIASKLYQQAGRPADAVQLMWTPFHRHPCFVGYLKLQESAKAASMWPEWRIRALMEIRMRMDEAVARNQGIDHSLLVQIFLYEEDVEAAWLEAKQGGCSTDLWLELAELRLKDHPEDAGFVLLEHGEHAMNEASSSHYQEVVGFLMRAASALKRAGLEREFVLRLHALRLKFKARKSFIALLDRNRRSLLF